MRPSAGQVCHSLMVAVKLYTGVSTTPCCMGYLIPQLLGIDLLHGLAVAAGFQFPVAIFFQCFEKAVWNADGVVGVLPGYGAICFTFIIARITGCN